MAALKTLTFTTIPNPGGDRILDRRTKIIARLEEQKLVYTVKNLRQDDVSWSRFEFVTPPRTLTSFRSRRADKYF